jgi:hypothetical protein
MSLAIGNPTLVSGPVPATEGMLDAADEPTRAVALSYAVPNLTLRYPVSLAAGPGDRERP